MTDDAPPVGSTFGDWLKEEGLEDDANAHAIKRVLAWQIEEAMKAQGIGKAARARRRRRGT